MQAKKYQAIFGVFLGGMTLFTFCLAPALAYTIDSADMPDKEDFMVGPGKHEVLLAPGESAVRTFSVTNRFANEKKFELLIQDFKGSRNLQDNIVLLGDDRGPYSLKDYLHPDVMSFTLQHGDRITIPVKIEVPADAQPGGLYGAILVRQVPLTREGEPAYEPEVKGGITVEARVATLFFVRVKGDAKEDGQIKEFSTDKKIYGQPPINFRIIFENNGNVYLNPYGELAVNNLLGTKVGESTIDPYYVMPDSLRLKQITLDRGFMFGRYTATLTLHRGYLEKDETDVKTIAFWVLPWKIVASIILVLFLIALILKGILNWFHRNFERRRR